MEDNYNQYKLYEKLYKQTEIQKLISNYFFIAINIVIIFLVSVLHSTLVFNQIISLTLLLLGIMISFYWIFEQREMTIIHEVRFKVLMKLERTFFDDGMLNSEWDEIGKYPYRRSPVLFIKFAKILPLIFIMAHIIIIMISFLHL